jgi:hypothetical protein
MLALYAVMVSFQLNIHVIIVMFGLFVAGTMYAVMRKHAENQKQFDSISLIGEHKR